MKTKTITRLLAIAAALFILHFSFFISRAAAQKRPELAPTPPMGWNSWNWYGPKVTEPDVVAAIDILASSGLRDAGYNYIVIDGGWREDFLDADGKLLPSADRFPRGMKWLAEYAHSKGFKFGLHIVPGRYDCRGNRIGSYGNEQTHLAQFLDWKLDFLKLDRCTLAKAGDNDPGGWTPARVRKEYTKWSEIFRNCGRDILLSVSNYKFTDWYPELSNMGRTTGDINAHYRGGAEFDKGENKSPEKPSWGWSVMAIADTNNQHAKHAGNGYWNDAEMLVTGDPNLTHEEQKAHFALWCVMSAPLFLGNDPRLMTPEELALISNRELIAINQDPTEQGSRILSANGAEVWMKKLRNNEYAILLLNRHRAPGEITVNFEKLGLPKTMRVRNLYDKKDLGEKTDLTAKFPTRDSLFIKATPIK